MAILVTPDRRNTVIEEYVTAEIFEAQPFADFDPAAYTIRPAPPTQLVDDGDIIDLGDRYFRIMHLPGHSPGSISLWEDKTRTLFSGDVIYDGPLYDHLYHSDIDDYVASLKRLKTLAVQTVHGGHHGSFGRERYVKLIDQYLARKRAGKP